MFNRSREVTARVYLSLIQRLVADAAKWTCHSLMSVKWQVTPVRVRTGVERVRAFAVLEGG